MNQNDKNLYSSYVDNNNNNGITFNDPSNMAEFLYVIASKGATYSVSHFTDNGEYWVVTLTGGF